MELIPHEELKMSHSFNFAPMIDFLFLMLAMFATLALSRASLYDSEVELTRCKGDQPIKSTAHHKEQVHLSISASGGYKWLTNTQEYPLENIQKVQEELLRQYQIGALPEDKTKGEILLHIDRNAPWEAIAKAIFGIREIGFVARPVYEGLEK